MTKKSDLPRIVLDTCLYIHYLSNQDKDLADRVSKLIDLHDDEHIILLPAIVQIETVGVARIRIPKKDTPAKREKAAWAAAEFFERAEFPIVQLDDEIVNRAIENVIKCDIKGADAAILATAELYNAQCLYTVDNDLLKLARSTNSKLQISEPPTL